MSNLNSLPLMSEQPLKPSLPATGAPVSFRNPFEDRDPAEVWQELLSEPLKPISREEAIRRMIESGKKC